MEEERWLDGHSAAPPRQNVSVHLHTRRGGPCGRPLRPKACLARKAPSPTTPAGDRSHTGARTADDRHGQQGGHKSRPYGNATAPTTPAGDRSHTGARTADDRHGQQGGHKVRPCNCAHGRPRLGVTAQPWSMPIEWHRPSACRMTWTRQVDRDRHESLSKPTDKKRAKGDCHSPFALVVRQRRRRAQRTVLRYAMTSARSCSERAPPYVLGITPST